MPQVLTWKHPRKDKFYASKAAYLKALKLEARRKLIGKRVTKSKRHLRKLLNVTYSDISEAISVLKDNTKHLQLIVAYSDYKEYLYCDDNRSSFHKYITERVYPIGLDTIFSSFRHIEFEIKKKYTEITFIASHYINGDLSCLSIRVSDWGAIQSALTECKLSGSEADQYELMRHFNAVFGDEIYGMNNITNEQLEMCIDTENKFDPFFDIPYWVQVLAIDKTNGYSKHPVTRLKGIFNRPDGPNQIDVCELDLDKHLFYPTNTLVVRK